MPLRRFFRPSFRGPLYQWSLETDHFSTCRFRTVIGFEINKTDIAGCFPGSSFPPKRVHLRQREPRRSGGSPAQDGSARLEGPRPAALERQRRRSLGSNLGRRLLLLRLRHLGRRRRQRTGDEKSQLLFLKRFSSGDSPLSHSFYAYHSKLIL